MPPKAKTAKPSKTKSSATAPPQTPAPVSLQWPAIPPPPPYAPLIPSVVLPAQIVTIPLFSPATCKSFVRFLEQIPLTTTPTIPKKGEATRYNDRFEVWDEDFARKLWVESGLQDVDYGVLEDGLEGKIVGLSPRIRIYKYKEGMFFDKHYDDSNTLTVNLPSGEEPEAPLVPTKVHTTWTLLVYLTGSEDGVVGGETVFYTDEHVLASTKKKHKGGGDGLETENGVIVPKLERGLALLHRHGRNCLLHEGKLVEKGVKWVLRSDLCIRA